MRRKVYKSLDKPSSLFGIKGSYLSWVLAGAGVALVFALMVNTITNGLVAILVFLALIVGVYLWVISFQSKYSERTRDKLFTARDLPDIILLQPRSLSKQRAYTLKSAEKEKDATKQKEGQS